MGQLVIYTPNQTNRNQDITSEQKQENKHNSRKIIVVEHLIRLVKIFRVADKIRLNSENYEPVILVGCGLIRWRIAAIVMCN